jgi:glycosyltransferase involved in cell wall biosynthesis
VSVVLPVLGGDVSRVGDAVASLAAQTHAAIEILVVHDGIAGTELADHLRHAPSGVRLLGLPGATLDAALNHAIEAARGDLIAHHDADGLSHPQRLARQVDYLRHHPDIDVVAASTMALSGSDAVPCGYLCEPDAQTPAALARRLEERHPLAHGSVIVRRAALERVGGYRPQAAGGAEAVERDLWLRLRDTSRMAKLPTRLYGRVVSLAPTGAGAPSGPRDGHAPPGAEGTLADAEAGGRLAALELR